MPALLLALYAGHVVDQHHRGRILAMCLAAQGGVAAALLGAHLVGHDSRALLLGLSLVLAELHGEGPCAQKLTLTGSRSASDEVDASMAAVRKPNRPETMRVGKASAALL